MATIKTATKNEEEAKLMRFEAFNDKIIQFVSDMVAIVPDNLRARYKLIVKAVSAKAQSEPKSILEQWILLTKPLRPFPAEIDLKNLKQTKPLFEAIGNHDELKELRLHDPQVLIRLGKNNIHQIWKRLYDMDQFATDIEKQKDEQYEAVTKLVDDEFLKKIETQQLDVFDVWDMVKKLSNDESVLKAFGFSGSEEGSKGEMSEEEQTKANEMNKKIEEMMNSMKFSKF